MEPFNYQRYYRFKLLYNMSIPTISYREDWFDHNMEQMRTTEYHSELVPHYLEGYEQEFLLLIKPERCRELEQKNLMKMESFISLTLD